jgi:hypothetical protein
VSRFLWLFQVLAISFFASCNRPLEPSHQLLIDDVILGQVSGGSQIPVMIRVTNLSARRITLDPPITDCGCLQTSKGSVILNAKESQEVEFILRTPIVPQHINRKITFVDSSNSSRQWKCALTGEVIEPFWSMPSSLTIEYEPVSAAISADLQIYRRDKEVPLSVVAGSDKLIVAVRDFHQSIFVNVTIDSTQHPEGEDVLLVQNGNQDTVLRIPVRWEKTPEITFFPEWLTLSPKEQTKTIVVNFGPNISKDDVTITCNVPWIKVNKLTLGESGGVIEILVDASKVSIPFEGRLFTLDAGVGGHFPYAAFVN